MSGKLPIDRAREAKFSRKLLEEQKQRLGKDQAQIRDEARAYDEPEPAVKRTDEGDRDEGDREEDERDEG